MAAPQLTSKGRIWDASFARGCCARRDVRALPGRTPTSLRGCANAHHYGSLCTCVHFCEPTSNVLSQYAQIQLYNYKRRNYYTVRTWCVISQKRVLFSRTSRAVNALPCTPCTAKFVHAQAQCPLSHARHACVEQVTGTFHDTTRTRPTVARRAMLLEPFGGHIFRFSRSCADLPRAATVVVRAKFWWK